MIRFPILFPMKSAILFFAYILCSAAPLAATANPDDPIDESALIEEITGQTEIKNIAATDELWLIVGDSLVKYRLVVTKAKNNTKKYVETGKKARIWSSGVSQPGTIDSITSDSILFNSQWISLSQIQYLRVHTVGTNTAGAAVTSLGAVVTILGVVLLVEGIQLLRQDQDDEFAQFFQTLAGLFVTGAGLATGGTGLLTTGGGITILALGKKYNFNKNWKLSTEKIVN
jgi:hypothetical protein